jgi:hypothetical protein
MTDNTRHEDPTSADAPGADWMLELLVRVANAMTSGSFLGVTLNVSGQVVTGRLISVIAYYRGYANMWEQALGVGDHSRNYVEPWRELADRMEKERLEGDEEKLPTPRYVHLSNARYVYGSGLIPTNDGLLWRGRISDVSAFSLGYLEIGGDQSA